LPSGHRRSMRDLVLLLSLLFALFAPDSGAADALLQHLDSLLQRNQTVELLSVLKDEQDSDALLDWLRLRAQEGHPPAQFELSRRLLAGAPKDRREAFKWYLVARTNEYLDQNDCEDRRRSEPVLRLTRKFSVSIGPGEELAYAQALDDAMDFALKSGVP